MNFIILRVDLTRVYVNEYYMLWVHLSQLRVISILLWVFVMYNYVQMTIHISICICHAQLCMNDYAYNYRLLSCTTLYKWQLYSKYLSNAFLYNGNIFMFPCFPANVNRLGRAPWCLSSQWWLLRRLWLLIFRIHHLHTALQCINSVVRLMHYTC